MITNRQEQFQRISKRRTNQPAWGGNRSLAAYLSLLFLVIAVAVLCLYFALTPATPASAAVDETRPAQPSNQAVNPDPNQASDSPPVVPSPTPTLQQALLPTVTPDGLLAEGLVTTPMPQPGQPCTIYLPTALTDLAESVTLTGITHEWQTWNNCGPATLSMALSYHGYELGQNYIGSVLRTNPDDKNVNPEELVAFAQSQGMAAVLRRNGDAQLLKRLLNLGLPVIVEVWLEPEPDDGFGHFRLLTGYDDETQRWIAYDSYVGENFVETDGAYSGIYVSYEQLKQQWRVFNRSFVVVYPPDTNAQVESALGALADDELMWQQTLEQAQAEIDENADDVFARFNRGTALVGLSQYEAAADAYHRAQEIGLPWRMLWYQFGPFTAYHETQQHQQLLTIVESALATTVNVEEHYYWKGVALASLGDTEGARAALQHALELRADYPEAVAALAALNP